MARRSQPPGLAAEFGCRRASVVLSPLRCRRVEPTGASLKRDGVACSCRKPTLAIDKMSSNSLCEFAQSLLPSVKPNARLNGALPESRREHCAQALPPTHSQYATSGKDMWRGAADTGLPKGRHL